MTFERQKVERGGDLVDRAASLTEMLLIASLEKQRAASAPEQHRNFDGEHCVDCEVAMPKPRLDLGRVRCVDCQTLLELERKQYGR